MKNANITLTNEQTELLQNTNYSILPYNEAKILFDELCKFIDNEIHCYVKKINELNETIENDNKNNFAKKTFIEYFQEQIKINVLFKTLLTEKFYNET
jgi:uncharacterized protein YaaW (UPF0174 family)